VKIITFDSVVNEVKKLCIRANCALPADVRKALEKSYTKEASPLGKSILMQCMANAVIAQKETIALCQDTGMSVFFIQYGRVSIQGGTIQQAVDEGVRQGYAEGFLRKSVVTDPLFDRTNTGDNTPAVIHLEHTDTEHLDITFVPKGAGAENMSRLAMLKPSDGVAGVVEFVLDTVISAGGNPCPPTIVGVGIGGTFEMAPLLAKKALLRPIGSLHPDKRYAGLEKRLLREINATGIGPQGLGGSITSFQVNIETFPCHIASMPVAVNIQCHASRHAHVRL